jgi:hypothetical protein
MREQVLRTQRLIADRHGWLLVALAFVMSSVVQANEAEPVEVPSTTIEQMQTIITAQIDAFFGRGCGCRLRLCRRADQDALPHRIDVRSNG